MDLIKLLLESLRRSENISQYLAQSQNLVGSQKPVSDPFLSMVQHMQSISVSAVPRIGMVVDYVPHLRSYRVQPEAGGPLIQCSNMVQGNTTVIGVTDASGYVPGTSVYYQQHPASTWGIIMGAVPYYEFDRRRNRADYIVQGSRAGLSVDPANQIGLMMGGRPGGGVKSWCGRMPVDSMAGVGEFVRMTESGMAITMDPRMISIRGDEASGLWIFYRNQWVRLAGYNYQHWTCGSEHLSQDDEGEHLWYHGVSGYTWEQLGQYRRPVPYTEIVSAEAVQLQTQYLSYVEPKPETIQPFHRTQIYQGYLGQGHKMMQVVPPKSGNIQLYPADDVYIGVAERTVTFDGAIGDRSARGISITKRPCLPVANRRWMAQDPKGDNRTGYRAAGYFGEGKAHKLASWPAKPSEHPQFVNALSVFDLHAHLFNWKGCHPFHYHEKDFHLPEEYELDLSSNQVVPEFKNLKTDHYLEPARKVSVQVDHKHTAEYYLNSSGLELLDDGSISLFDGFGFNLYTTGGDAWITLPGDLHMEAGRSLIGWGGRDVILRANKSMDLTANKGDFRAKAENNMMLIGANGGGQHGVMIESRSVGKDIQMEQPGEQAQPVGIILRSPNSPVVTLADSVYCRTLVGDIVLDANDMKADVNVHAANMRRFLSFAATDYYGTEDSWTTINVFTQGFAYLDVALCHIDGQLVNSGSHVTEGNMMVVGGHIYTEVGNKEVGELRGLPLRASKDRLKEGEKALKQAHTEAPKVYDREISNPWYSIYRPGNADTIETCMCSLRIMDDYRSDEFILFESRWSQMARLGGKEVEFWTENAVEFRSQQTYPYPGKEKLVEEEVYYYFDPTMYEMGQGVATARGAVYEVPKLGEPLKKKLNGNYRIIDNDGPGTARTQSPTSTSPGDSPGNSDNSFTQ